MNQKARKLSEQLVKRKELRKNLVKVQEENLKDFDKETEDLKQKLDNILMVENPQNKSTEAWCRITNALIRKYKPMTEEDPVRALKELTRIEGALLAGGFLTEQELKEAL